MNLIHYYVDRVFLILGKKCNFNCVYCFQQSSDKGESGKVNSDVFEFIKSITERQERNIHVQFYGGEPLLYKQNLKACLENLAEIKGKLRYGLVTNGSLLDKNTVELLNLNNVHVNISHDGENTCITRKHDALLNNKHFYELNDAGIISIISKYAYPKQIYESYIAHNEIYKRIHGKDLILSMDTVFPYNKDNSLCSLSVQRVYSEMKEIISAHESGIHEFLKRHIQSVSDFIKKHEHGINVQYPYCSGGIRVVNIDMEGNLYSCHNSYEKAGTIYSDFYTVMSNSLKRNNSQRFNRCNVCPVVYLCQGGCSRVSKENLDRYCSLRTAFFLPIIEYILDKGTSNEVSE